METRGGGLVKEHSWECSCFIKVYVCPGHVSAAGRSLDAAMGALTEQLNLAILPERAERVARGDGSESE